MLGGLEKSGEGMLDEVYDVEEEEYERELEYEQDAGEVEYISDAVESDEEDDDLSDLEDWLGDNSISGQEEASEYHSDGSEDEEEEAKFAKAMPELKRKSLASTKPPKPAKKVSKDTPKREIVYEMEREPVERQMLTV